MLQNTVVWTLVEHRSSCRTCVYVTVRHMFGEHITEIHGKHEEVKDKVWFGEKG